MLKNRFLTVLSLFFAAGIAVNFCAGGGGGAVCFFVFLGVSAVALAGYLLLREREKVWEKALAYLLFASVGLSAGAGWALLREKPYEKYVSFEGLSDTVIGTVSESGSSSESDSVVLRVSKSKQALPAGTGVRLYLSSGVRLLAGDEVTAELVYYGVTDVRRRSEGATLNAGGTLLSVRRRTGVLSRLRGSLSAYCEKLYSPYGQEGLAEALLLRERSKVSPETNSAFRNAGLSHVLAISGLHLIVLMAVLRRFLQAAGLHRILSDAVCILLSFGYAVLTGGSPSILRAAIMMTVVLASGWFFRSPDGISSLSAALLLLLLANPFSLYSLSLQLSFLSCLGILTIAPLAEALRDRLTGGKGRNAGFPRKALSAMAESGAISLAAVLFTFPVTALAFSSVSWIAPFANLLVVPLFPYLLTLLLLSVLCGPLFLPAARVLAFLPGNALKGLEAALRFLDERSVGSFALPEDRAWIPALFAAAAVFGLFFLQKHRKAVSLVSVCGLVTSVLVLLLLPSGGAQEPLLFLSEEGYLFSRSESGTVFADLGGEESFFTGALPADCEQIDAYLLLSADEESAERLKLMLSRWRICAVYLPDSGENGQKNDLSDLKTFAKSKNCDIMEYQVLAKLNGLTFDLSGERFLFPDGTEVFRGESGWTLRKAAYAPEFGGGE